MPTPGILTVSSRLSHPTTLTPTHLCAWYENTHIQQVTSLPGVPRAARYEALSPSPSSAPNQWSALAPWFTVYELPDLDYRHSAEFKGLDGQSKPDEALLEGVFRQARFDTRFYEEVQRYGDESKCAPAKFLVSAALQPRAGGERDFEAWYREEHLERLSRVRGYVRSRRYRVVDATVLDRFERRGAEGCPQYLALHEFEGEELDMEGLGLEGEEIGWWGLKRVYGEYEQDART
ncbi:hypothetical protein EJ04DRAFT_494675 [Polyplosphaeria fusca]|uniref:Uncharacterized protein n=1 Tax=Polyplosphaeria fusca TaxID=682080 RepID=A0A9P4QZ95_9PLEO|nr:hypothetical protein EJ04DRAFT_494675 [Polyplosphaeria fusca]